MQFHDPEDDGGESAEADVERHRGEPGPVGGRPPRASVRRWAWGLIAVGLAVPLLAFGIQSATFSPGPSWTSLRWWANLLYVAAPSVGSGLLVAGVVVLVLLSLMPALGRGPRDGAHLGDRTPRARNDSGRQQPPGDARSDSTADVRSGPSPGR